MSGNIDSIMRKLRIEDATTSVYGILVILFLIGVVLVFFALSVREYKMFGGLVLILSVVGLYRTYVVEKECDV